MNDEKLKSNTDLADIRVKIDATDQALLDLLARRADLVKEVVQAKFSAGDARILRPAREAHQMRKFIDWHQKTKSAIPLTGLLAIWREIISASVSQQTPLKVHCSSANAELNIEARAQFGGAATYHAHKSVRGAYDAMLADEQSIAVLSFGGNYKWWREMSSDVKIFARLPIFNLGSSGADEDKKRAMFCVGRVGVEESGNDVTLIVGAKATLPDGATILADDGEACLAAVDGYVVSSRNMREAAGGEEMTFDNYTFVGGYARVRV